MSVVTWLRPYLSTCGFLVFTSWPSFFCWAISIIRVFFAFFVSGMYFFASFRTADAWFLSMVVLNWWRAGGILRRISMMRFFLCSWMYLGHLTKRVRSRFGWTSPPIRKFLGAFSKSVLLTAFFFFSAKGALGSFLPFEAGLAALPMVTNVMGRCTLRALSRPT